MAERNVVFISGDNRKMHVGTENEILAHLGITTANVDSVRTGLEIYDERAQRLTVEIPDSGPAQLRKLPDRQQTMTERVLLDRIVLVLAAMQVKVNGMTDPDLRDFRVPMIFGPLDVVLAGLAAAFGSLSDASTPPPPDGGGPMHRASDHPHT